MTKQHITLLVPGLFNSIAALPPTMPAFTALETLLSRADQSEQTINAYYARILELFDIGHTRDIPVAAVSRYADSGDRDGHIWMHIDPVYLNADKDRLILQGREILGLSMTEANTIIMELNTLFTEDGWYCEATRPERWYVRLPRQPAAHFHALMDALGRSVEPYMPTGNDRSEWHRFMNEAQMLLHASSVNHTRAQEDKLPVNSLWCWGPGKLPGQVTSVWDTVYTEEPFVKGLALLSDTAVHPLPESVVSVIPGLKLSANDAPEHRTLVVLDPSERDILSLDFEHYLDKLSQLEKNWFSPLLHSLKAGEISSISLLTCNALGYTLKRHHLWRLWRKRNRLSLVKTGS